MAFTQSQLDAIDSAIASGELKVAFDGREVVYRSMDDLMKARLTIKSSLEAAGITTAVKRTSYVSRSRN